MANGRRLWSRAVNIVAMMDKTMAEFSGNNGELFGEIHLGCGESPTVITPVMQIIARFVSLHPSVSFHLYTGTAGDIIKRLNQGILDFGIINSSADIKTGVGYTVGYESMTSIDEELCFRPFHPALPASNSLIWQKQQSLSPAAALYLRMLREAVQ